MVNYYTPASLPEALETLKMLKDTDYLIYAGGTDINSRNMTGTSLVFIGKIPELKKIEIIDGELHIGACVTYSEAEASPIVPDIMKAAIRKLAGPAVRNAGTFGGNLANGSGKSDTVLVDMVLNAVINVSSADAPRQIEAAEFYRTDGFSDIRLGELITEIIIPMKDYFRNYYYNKVSDRDALAISNLTIGAVWNVKDNTLNALSLGLGAATAHPVRCTAIEQALTGKKFSEIAIKKDEIIAGYVNTLDLPLDRTSREYRLEICRRIMKHLISEIIR